MQIPRLIGSLSLLACFAALWPVSAPAQWAFFDTPTTSTAQRNALNSVRSQVRWLQTSTRTAPHVGEQGYGTVWRSFQDLRLGFVALTQTLTPQQSMYGANNLAELNVGLDIIQEAFRNYEEDIAGGRPSGPALEKMCLVLRQSSAVWQQELNKTSSRLRIGWLAQGHYASPRGIHVVWKNRARTGRQPGGAALPIWSRPESS
jgi:hypothetical protein